jgi:PAS domain S-box-containing protein
MTARKTPNLKIIPANRKTRPVRAAIKINTKISKAFSSAHIHQLAFNNSLLPNIISIVSSDKIIDVNQAAAHLLGYSKKALPGMHMRDIFASLDPDFKRMQKQRSKSGHAVENITAIKKDGKKLSCQITSVEFTGENHIQKAISTLIDRTDDIRKQKSIDFKREKQSDAEMVLAQYKSDAILNRLVDLEHKLDSEISVKEQLQSSSAFQEIAFKKEREKETKVRKKEIANAVTNAKALERTDLGMELHDNVNQLLAASRLYLEIARKSKDHREMYLNRSSQYTLNAIEEIRKLAKGLINNVIKNLSLCEAILGISHDIMEVYPIKITCNMDSEIHPKVNAKFNLNIFRIVQEQLNNIIKHARATIVKINLSQNKKNIILSVSDNGSGFNIHKKVKGIGILNIKSRAESFKGTAHFVSQPGKGCVLTVLFPPVGSLTKQVGQV